MSLLTIVQDAAPLIGLQRPATVASADDETSRLLVLLATRAAMDTVQAHSWSGLTRSGAFTGDGVATDFTLPADFARFASGQALLLENGVGTLLTGPLAPDQVTRIRASSLVPATWYWWRRGRTVTFSPALTAGRGVFFEYVSANWCVPPTGAARARFQLDDDTVEAFHEDLVMLGLVWRFKAAKGLEYAQAYEDWRQRLQLEAAADQSLQPVASGPCWDGLPDVHIGPIAVTSGDDLELN